MLSPGEEKGERNTGVNRTLILAHGQGWDERHFNLRKILEILDLEQVQFSLAGDLKLLNLLLGISNHGGTHACLYCTGTLEEATVAAEERTFGSILQDHSRYINDNRPVKHQSQYNNCIRSCLYPVADPEATILSTIPPPA